MTKTITRLLAATAVAGSIALAAPAFAQASKVATINPADAIFNARAVQTAMQQIEAKYTAQVQAAQTRQTALQAQTKPLLDALDTNKDGNVDQAELQAAVQARKPQVEQIRAAETAASTEINASLRPMNLARIYIFDQLQQRYNAAIDGQVRTKQIGLIVPTSAAIRQAPGTDLTALVRAEIDKPLTIDPPAGWQPNQDAVGLFEAYAQAVSETNQRNAAAAQQQQGAAAGAARQPGATPAPAPAPTPAREPGR